MPYEVQRETLMTRFLLPLLLFGWVSACAAASSGPASTPASDPASAPLDRRRPRPAVSGFGFSVSDLEASRTFFQTQLGAVELGRAAAQGPELDALVGIDGLSARAVHLRVGEEVVTLTAWKGEGPARRPGPDAQSNDADFQHLALVVSDIDRAHEKVLAGGAVPISLSGPERIPESNLAAAGIRAFYFRDRDRHPLELIWFPAGKGAPRWQASSPLVLGVDHSAFSAASTDESLAFYVDGLGFEVAGRSFNTGIEQERLSGVADARVRITGLRGESGPGLELLVYEAPGPGQPRPSADTPIDLFYWETTVVVEDLEAVLAVVRGQGRRVRSRRIASCQLCWGGGRAALVEDPDGHVMRLVSR
ncbi:MAG: VOC family protein [Myxococcota bacterium]